jgi:zinc/manganese transport system substrate-binding protein
MFYQSPRRAGRAARAAIALCLSCLASLALGCSAGKPPAAAADGRPLIVASYGSLASLAAELAGDQARVVCLMPNGLDPHEWEPSAQDIATLNRASLVLRNGLGLEAGMTGALDQAARDGVPVFTAADHVAVRRVQAGEGLAGDDPDQAPGAQDPHLWLSPVAMKAVAAALAARLERDHGIDAGARLADFIARTDRLDASLAARFAALPPERRLLVSGHESMGYFAEHYGLTLVGAVVPGLSSQGQVSAAGLAALKAAIGQRRVGVLFTELGTPQRVAEALAREMGLRVVEANTHVLPADGSWLGLMAELGATVAAALAAD